MASDAGRVIPLPKGAWNALTTYETLDIVSYGNQTWMAKLSSIGITPTEGQYWTVYGSTAAMASTTAMGIVKIPTDGTITIDSDGTIHSAGGSASSISTTDPSKSVQDVLDDLDADKADSATTLAGYGITDAKIESGIITLGNNTLKPVSTVDTALSDTSINPVQNKVINSALDTLSNEKANTTDVYGTSDEYNSVASYVVGDMCIYNGKLYKCLVSCTGIVPTNTSYWENVSLSKVVTHIFPNYSKRENVGIGSVSSGKTITISKDCYFFGWLYSASACTATYYINDVIVLQCDSSGRFAYISTPLKKGDVFKIEVTRTCEGCSFNETDFY